MATITFDKSAKHILLAVVDIQVSVQELADAIRTYEATLTNLDLAQMMQATGKDPIGGGTSTAITLTLLDGWKLNAQARGSPTVVTVFGGNFITDDESTPFAPATNVSYDRAQAVSATILAQQTLENLEHHVEAQALGNATGNTFYWNPDTGVDTNDGTSADTAVLTFAQAHTLCVDGRGDVIYCITPDSMGDFTITENITITKNNVHLRGQGRHQIFQPNTASVDTIFINNAKDVEISGFEIRTHATGTNDGIRMHGERTVLQDCYITQFTGKGIYIMACINCRIVDCKIVGGTGVTANEAGLYIEDAKDWIFTNCEFTGHAYNGATLVSTLANDTERGIFRNCTFNESANYQLEVGTNCGDVIIDQDSWISGESGVGRLLDNGLDTHDLDITNQVNNITAKGGRSLDR